MVQILVGMQHAREGDDRERQHRKWERDRQRNGRGRQQPDAHDAQPRAELEARACPDQPCNWLGHARGLRGAHGWTEGWQGGDRLGCCRDVAGWGL